MNHSTPKAQGLDVVRFDATSSLGLLCNHVASIPLREAEGIHGDSKIRYTYYYETKMAGCLIAFFWIDKQA